MTDTLELPWLSIAPGFSLKLLHGDVERDTRALLLRLEPGTIVPRHRHGGDVHAYNVAGSRQLDTGEIVGPGDYVYEPAGNIDSWRAIGDETVLVHVIVTGTLDYIDDAGEIISRSTTRSIAARYGELLGGRS